MYGCQDKAYKITEDLNNAEKDTIIFNPIPLHQWKQYYQELWTNKEAAAIIMVENEVSIDSITLDELLLTLRSFKNKNKKRPRQYEYRIYKKGITNLPF
jgi:c-di-AMP phosphodiesterase-like protein